MDDEQKISEHFKALIIIRNCLDGNSFVDALKPISASLAKQLADFADHVIQGSSIEDALYKINGEKNE